MSDVSSTIDSLIIIWKLNYAVQIKHTQNGFSIKNLVNKSKGQKNTRYLQNKQYSKLNYDYVIVIQELKIVW